jgi:hypothetical protein
MSVLLIVAMLISSGNTCFAAGDGARNQKANNANSTSSVIVTKDGINLDGTFYTPEEFSRLLESATEVQVPKSRIAGVGAIPLAAGTWYIPGVGQVI